VTRSISSDKSRLTDTEKAVRAAIESGKVTHNLIKIDSEVAISALTGDLPAGNGGDQEPKEEKLQLCPRCQFALKCECTTCPNCPNNFIVESDTPTN